MPVSWDDAAAGRDSILHAQRRFMWLGMALCNSNRDCVNLIAGAWDLLGAVCSGQQRLLFAALLHFRGIAFNELHKQGTFCVSQARPLLSSSACALHASLAPGGCSKCSRWRNAQGSPSAPFIRPLEQCPTYPSRRRQAQRAMGRPAGP